MHDDSRSVTVAGKHGRDVGKAFRIAETGPLQMASFVLRLVSALRVESYEAMLASLRKNEAEGKAPIDEIMRLLQGCDPERVAALLREMLTSVQIAPDPKHPEAFRALLEDDIKEMRTLGDIVMAFGKLNFNVGG